MRLGNEYTYWHRTYAIDYQMSHIDNQIARELEIIVGTDKKHWITEVILTMC